jgi:hypothetical protein
VSALLTKFGVSTRSQLSDFSAARMFDPAQAANTAKKDTDARTAVSSTNKKVSYLPNRSTAAFAN